MIMLLNVEISYLLEPIFFRELIFIHDVEHTGVPSDSILLLRCLAANLA